MNVPPDDNSPLKKELERVREQLRAAVKLTKREAVTARAEAEIQELERAFNLPSEEN